jgi:hypothetical protein
MDYSENRLPLWVIAGAGAVALGAAVPGGAEDAPPVYISIEMTGKPWAGEDCEGGDWALDWSGPVTVQDGPPEDVLASYTAFYSSESDQERFRNVRFTSTGVKCRDKDTGGVALRSTIESTDSNKVSVNVSLAPASGVNSPGFSFMADELGACRVESTVSMEPFPLSVAFHGGGANRLSPGLDITAEDLENGFSKTYRFDGVVAGTPPMCMGNELAGGKITLRYKQGEDDAEVSMDACLHLAKNELRTVSAQGTPEGGTYRFGASGVAFNVRDQSGAQADVLGANPGKGDVTVWYQHGNSIPSVTLAGTVVDVLSINNGAEIPKLGIFGADGLKIDGTRAFPLRLDPLDGFVQMTLEDETLASVVNTSSKLELQPTKIGRTFMQARTLCGTPLGPRVPVEVVRCDEDVIKELRRQQADLKNQIDQLVRRITSLLAGDDFQTAANEIGQSTKDLAVKTGESIVGTLTFRDAKRMEWVKRRNYAFGPEVDMWKNLPRDENRLMWVKGVYTMGDVMNDLGDAVDSNDWQKELKPFFSVGIELLRNEAIGLGKTYGEAIMAAEKFGRQLGTLEGTAEQLRNLEPQLDNLVKTLIRITTRLEYCEKARIRIEDPTPVPVDPTPQPTPVEIEEPVEIPVPEEPKPETTDPVPPSTEDGKSVVGLACRVQDLRAPGVSQRLTALRQSVLAARTSDTAQADQSGFVQVSVDTALTRATELDALNDFTRGLSALRQTAEAQRRQVESARTALQKWQGAIEQMAGAMSGSDAQGLAAARTFHDATRDFAMETARYGHAGFDTLIETDECRDRLEVKVDQVRARYN